MAPLKKKCCVPYCNNIPNETKKQFFKLAASLKDEKWIRSTGKRFSQKSNVLLCCEDHFDLPNDAENYIRYKYQPGKNLRLRSTVLPHKNLPVNVCRICLKLIYNGEYPVDISEKNAPEHAKIVATVMPEIDLKITIEPVACAKCFESLESFYKIKSKALESEVTIVTCIKSVINKMPAKMTKDCSIDLFEEYAELQGILNKKETAAEVSEAVKKPLADNIPEKIILHVESNNENDQNLVVEEKLIIEVSNTQLSQNIETGKVSDVSLRISDASMVQKKDAEITSDNKHDVIRYKVVDNLQIPSTAPMYIVQMDNIENATTD